MNVNLYINNPTPDRSRAVAAAAATAHTARRQLHYRQGATLLSLRLSPADRPITALYCVPVLPQGTIILRHWWEPLCGARRMDLSVVKQDLGPYRQLDRQRDGFQRAFDQFLAAEPGLRGDVLDIGAGAGPSPFPTNLPRRIDGVDPSDAVLKHPSLTRRWYGAFETADIPPASYDLALAYNVAEHIEHARPFFQKVRSVLKPGGVFWALTPHGRHPFCKIARAVELLGGKRAIARRAVNVNAYSSYYRLNTP